MAESGTVAAGNQATALQYNNLRKDVLDNTLSHDHTGAADHGVRLQKMTSGSYTGNDTQDRAIPHGLGVVPKAVLIQSVGSTVFNAIVGATARISSHISGGDATQYTVTVIDNTNFYVGDIAQYAGTANASGVDYYWAAFG